MHEHEIEMYKWAILEYRVYLFLMHTACGMNMSVCVLGWACVCVCTKKKGKICSLRANKPPITKKKKAKNQNRKEQTYT